MGQRLGRVEALARQGITPIAPDEGIAILRRLVTEPTDRVTQIVTGRFGDPPTLEVARPELPFLRFLEEPRLFYPGVELVVDLELSEEADPYLADHVFRGERLFPAVMVLEGMVQVAAALTGRSAPIELEGVQFLRPIVVPEGERRTIRIVALARADDRVDVVVRGEATGFQADHMRATVRFAAASSTPLQRELMPNGTVGEVGLVPERDLYGDILFHGGRFRRLAGYRALRATRCLAVVSAGETTGWFGRYMPDRLLLGDPAARDAAIHALQACIPHASVLPIGVERLTIDGGGGPGHRFVAARERERRGNTFIYDLQITDELGQTLERWEGLALQAIETRAPERPWAAPLLGPYLERRVQELIPGANPAIVVTNGGAERRVRSEAAIQSALGMEALVCRRPDGRPDLPAHPGISSSTAHADPLTLAVASRLPVGCDLEMVASRSPAVWRDLLGHERFTLAEVIARSANEDLDTAGTRVWAAMEAEKKAGAAANGLVFAGSTGDGWVTIAAGTRVCATCAFPVRGMREPLVAAVSVKGAVDAIL
jgi:enediyne polyketide synthase